ncbi:hypothetical protein DH2020_042350 [Rehmannia glutinosa]|uniref:Pectinesterase inhibitor domain-containing protein n=1 Tax=Rehmannia glutinosa TaxID=99300 RepID=A0ABR0UNI2_REHGL
MAIFGTVPLLLALTVLCCFLPSLPFLSAAAKKPELAIQVCKKTTDFKFCRQTIYSDPRAPDADRVVLAYIAFKNASKIGGGGGKSGILKGLKSCLADYNQAIGDLSEVLRDLDDETYYDFDKLSREAESRARACEKGFRGRSPIAKGNSDLIKLTNICYVVSKLFKYND